MKTSALSQVSSEYPFVFNLALSIKMEILIPIIFVLLILFWRFSKSDTTEEIGELGEKNTAKILYFLNKKKYKVINNLVLKSGKFTTQIDHIVISDYGIFVIETKNFKGWILGNENSEYWTQVLFNRKEKLYNPIRQNLGHINALKRCLSAYPNIVYKSIIVFYANADLKVNTHTDVVYSDNLLETIRKYTAINLSAIDKKSIFEKISSSNLIGSFNQREHVESINQRIQKRAIAIEANKCPHCNGDLVMRTGKYGNFLGCRSFPYCKFSQNVSRN